MKRYDLLVIGGGPAGLSAAIEARRNGMKVAVFDENTRPGGQLFKQIHKFFGSKEHKAKMRGFNIGNELLRDAHTLGVDVYLNSVVIGIYDPLRITVEQEDHITSYSGDNIIVATGASESMIPFDGWTLPGVIGAGAAQTMMNLHGVKPGEDVLMVGSGNVGLVVSYQLMQAGCKVVAIIDAAPRVGGYGVHAAKVARVGVPFYLSHTIVKAEGNGRVEKVTISQVDPSWQPVRGTEKTFDVDTICMAVGLSPMSQLAKMAGCKMVDKGGLVPECDQYGHTSIPGIFAAGDVAGIEEASSAMIGGRIAALAAAKRSGFIEEYEFIKLQVEAASALEQLRKGMFSHKNRGRTDLVRTDEGYPLSKNLLKRGFITEDEIDDFPCACGFNTKGPHPVIECTQNIPCDPCQDACKFGCITVGDIITGIPMVNHEKKCTNCGMCVAACSGQAIFIVDEDYEENFATVTMPYEFIPLPKVGEIGNGISRAGVFQCPAEVISIRKNKVFDHTNLLTIKIPKEYAKKVRFYKRKGLGCDV